MNQVSTAALGPERIYRDHLAQGRFMIQRCDACAVHVFYPRLLCPACGSSSLSWIAPSGAGTVYSTTVMRRKPDSGGDFNVAVIELREGPRLMSRVENVAPDHVRIGMDVVARIVEEGEEGHLVVFDLAGDKHGV
jgi:uncharacterized OB-fold protein